MKTVELVKRYPQTFLVWNLNEESGAFWTDLTVLEDNGFKDPWGQRITLRSAKRITNSTNDVIEHRLTTEYQGYPVELSIMNE